MVYDQDRCYGCGLCRTTCPENCIQLLRRENLCPENY
jgi:NAD-dependent dihydropyrimidine dehydrogenase PreA subunit